MAASSTVLSIPPAISAHVAASIGPLDNQVRFRPNADGGNLPMNVTQPAMTEQETADRLGLSVKTLQAWRYRRTGPKFVRFGRAVRYMPSDLDAFIRASEVDTCGEEQVRS